jgi:hypothetical protein
MIRYLVFALFPFVLISQDIDYRYVGEPYYPEQYLEKQDSLKWPLIFDITIDVKDIKGLDESEDKFFSKLVVSSFSEYDYEYITNLGESIDLSHDEFFYLDYKENSLTSEVESDPRPYKKSKYEYLFYDKFFSKTVKLIEAPFDHNWNLRDFPFDEQKLKYKFTAHMDTSVVRLRPSYKFKSSFNKSMENLKEGFNVKEVKFNHTYNTDRHDPILISPGFIRPIVTETLEIILILDRQGSWLFLKLFMGGVLSFFISCMIFLIPLHKELESKVSLGVGAIFGAIGNRYFVDSTLEGVQTFTKADAISNLIILMVILNIFIVILQNSKYTYFSFFQSKVNSLFYSIYAFIILLLAILIW